MEKEQERDKRDKRDKEGLTINRDIKAWVRVRVGARW